MKKYRLVLCSEDKNGKRLYAVVATRDFVCQGRKVKKGDYGGMISGPHNLSQKGNCWIAYGATVLEEAKIIGDAYVGTNSVIRGDILIGEKAKVEAAEIDCTAEIEGNNIWCTHYKPIKSNVSGDAEIKGGHIRILNGSSVSGLSKIEGDELDIVGSIINGGKIIGRDIRIRNVYLESEISGQHIELDSTRSDMRMDIKENALISGEEIIITTYSKVTIAGNAKIGSKTKSFDFSGTINGNSKLNWD